MSALDVSKHSANLENTAKGSDQPRELIVFVPGIMGSALLYEGPGELGDRVKEYLWSEDVSDLLFGRRLDRLAYPSPPGSVVTATHVLQRVTLYGFSLLLPRTEIYARLLARWGSLALPKKRVLESFAYDWRQSIKQSAQRLTETVLQLADAYRCESLVLVGHSMGGLVCRLAVATSPKLARSVRVLATIATPLQGSSKAFWTLTRFPVLNPAYTGALRLVKFKDALTLGNAFGRIMDAIKTCPSVYELLPPKSIRCLLMPTGRLRSCMDEELWLVPFRPLVSRARAFHNTLSRTLAKAKPVRVVYSGSHPTDHLYQMRGGPPYEFLGERVEREDAQVPGDCTVTVDSAIHDCDLEALYVERSEPNEHLSLCRNDNTLEQLERVIFSE